MTLPAVGSKRQSITETKHDIKDGGPHIKNCIAPNRCCCACNPGVASVVLPAVKILDAIYSTRITLEGLALRHGMKHEDWPEAVLESLKARHNHIYNQIQDQICSLGGAYHPLGATSAS